MLSCELTMQGGKSGKQIGNSGDRLRLNDPQGWD